MCIGGCYSCRAALRLCWPSFSPDWPSALNFFLLLFFLFFPFLLFLLFFFYFSLVFLFFFGFGVFFFIFIVLLTTFEVFMVLVALLVDCSGLKLTFVAGSESIPPFASFTSFVVICWCPLSLFLFFPCFECD